MERVQQVLCRAKEILEQGWTQGTYARDEHGVEADWASPEAVTFCSVGAVYRATSELEPDRTSDVFDPLRWLARAALLRHVLGKHGVNTVGFNDHPDRTQEEVVAVFDELCNQ